MFLVILCFSCTTVRSHNSQDSCAAHENLLPELSEKRMLLMDGVAVWKWCHHAPVEDLPREQKILESMIAQGASLGIEKDKVRTFMQAQMDAAKEVQKKAFIRFQETGFVCNEDKIDFINSEMLLSLQRGYR